MQCKLGKGKKGCPHETEDPICCWRADCDGWIHVPCCTLLLDRYEVKPEDRPTDEDRVQPDNLPVVFCALNCQKKWKSERNKKIREAKKKEKEAQDAANKKPKKVPWTADGSLDVLMDWLTTESNCAKYCGSNGNKGKTKTAHHKDIALLIKSKKPETNREEKDVANKIQSLEQQFREATDWIENTGQGVTDENEFETYVLRLCPLYRQLEDVMLERPNARPISTNEGDPPVESEEEVSDEEEGVLGGDDEDDEGVKIVDEGVKTAVEQSAATPAAAKGIKKRLTSSTATVPSKKKNRNRSTAKTDQFLSSLLGDDSDDDKESFHSLRCREVTAREKEASARMLEAKSNVEKTNKEIAILTIDERVKVIRERAKLIQEGIATEENIDTLLPLN